jgi:hypothetical protein
LFVTNSVNHSANLWKIFHTLNSSTNILSHIYRIPSERNTILRSKPSSVKSIQTEPSGSFQNSFSKPI